MISFVAKLKHLKKTSKKKKLKVNIYNTLVNMLRYKKRQPC